MTRAPRVAFFPDSYAEVNGVARTSRQLTAFARAREFPLLCVHAGRATRVIHETPRLTRVELERGRMSFGLERDLRFDLRLWRHRRTVRAQVEAFDAEVIHVTGPSDVGLLGATLAHSMGLPLVASWHTNLHDFASHRLASALRFVGAGVRQKISAVAARQALGAVLDFYRLACVVLAPNEELAALLRRATRRPVFPMPRGVDAALFAPRPDRRAEGEFRIGYVGRLSPEKDVRTLAAIEAALLRAGAPPFRFVIVGDGSERAWLEARMTRAIFEGVLEGAPLARAYANFDVFIFPSVTDTYGNVVLESLACGTPVVVTSGGGPKFLIEDGVTGFVRDGAAGHAEAVLALMRDPERLARMRVAARRHAEAASWERVFEGVYEAYRAGLAAHRERGSHDVGEGRGQSLIGRAIAWRWSAQRGRPAVHPSAPTTA